MIPPQKKDSKKFIQLFKSMSEYVIRSARKKKSSFLIFSISFHFFFFISLLKDKSGYLTCFFKKERFPKFPKMCFFSTKQHPKARYSLTTVSTQEVTVQLHYLILLYESTHNSKQNKFLLFSK